MEKNVYIETLGCNKNQMDSEKMSYLLKKSGYTIVDNSDDAYYLIVNTCGFIDKAKEEAIDTIMEMVRIKEQNGKKKVIVAGCLAQRYSDTLQKEIPEIDVVFGVGDVSKITEIINKSNAVVIPEYTEDKLIEREIDGYPGSAYLRISDGCSNNCAYCAIPLIRGGLRSRTEESILKEVDFLLEKNIKEIILISQDTTNYGVDAGGKRKLADLMEMVSDKMPLDSWVRILYMHPDHIKEDLLQRLVKIDKFVPYFDIPFQSASEKILKKMGRSGSKEKYLNLVSMIKRYFPDAVVRSTFIVGFPGENEADFNETMTFIKEASLDWVGGFAYSDEEDTKAYGFEDKVEDDVKNERLSLFLDLAESTGKKSISRFIGTTQDILLEEKVVDEDLFIGRFWGQAPEVDGLTVVSIDDGEPGTFVKAEIKQLNNNDFYAVEV